METQAARNLLKLLTPNFLKEELQLPRMRGRAAPNLKTEGEQNWQTYEIGKNCKSFEKKLKYYIFIK